MAEDMWINQIKSSGPASRFFAREFDSSIHIKQTPISFAIYVCAAVHAYISIYLIYALYMYLQIDYRAIFDDLVARWEYIKSFARSLDLKISGRRMGRERFSTRYKTFGAKFRQEM